MEDNKLNRFRKKKAETEADYLEYIVELKKELEQAETVLAALRGEKLAAVQKVDARYDVIYDIVNVLIDSAPVLEEDIIAKVEPIARKRNILDPRLQIHKSLLYHTNPEHASKVPEDHALVCVTWKHGKLVEVPFRKGSSRVPPDNLIMPRSRLES